MGAAGSPPARGPAGDPARRSAALVAAGLLLALGVGVTSKLLQDRQVDEESKARRRQSMRSVAEGWHFRQWEQDLKH